MPAQRPKRFCTETRASLFRLVTQERSHPQSIACLAMRPCAPPWESGRERVLLIASGSIDVSLSTSKRSTQHWIAVRARDDAGVDDAGVSRNSDRQRHPGAPLKDV